MGGTKGGGRTRRLPRGRRGGAVLLLVGLAFGLLGVERPKGLGDVREVRTWSYPDYTRVVVELTRSVDLTDDAVVRLGADERAKRPERLYVDVPGIWVGRRYVDGVPVGDGLLQGVRIGQNTLHASRIVIDLERYGDHRMFTLRSPDRVVIDVYGARSGAREESETAPTTSRSRRLSMASRPIHTVVVDPGHGGKDPGAIGVGGLREKDVNLRLAKLLARRLEARSFRVVMTRDDDRYVDLEERTVIAESAEGDLFVLLLEDLAARGCRFSDGAWGVGADAAAGALEDLARFHARFEDASIRDALAPWLRAPEGGPGSEATAGLMRMVLDQNAESLSPAYRAIGELYTEHHAWFHEMWHDGPPTYVHGDLHIGNVFLDGDRVGFIDWGLSRTSTHLRDASYFLTMTVDIEERRANEEALLRTYLDALRSAGGVEISFDDAWQAHRLQSSYTVVATFLAYMPSYRTGDGVTLGKSLLARANAALEDLEVVDAVRAAL